MINAVMNSASVQKLKSILHNRYGKGLDISTMTEVTDIAMGSQSFHKHGNSMLIPIIVNNNYFATASVADVESLSDDEQLAISYLVRMILEPTMYNWHLSQIAQNVQAHDVINDKDSNIVSLFKTHFENESDDSSEAVSFASSIVCLQSHNPHMIHKVAAEIHEISDRWAFLKYAEIQSNVSSAKDLKDMGAVTLLIEDLLSLTPEMQASLAEILKQTSQTQDPLFLIGISSPLSQLIQDNMIHADLAKILHGHLLDIDRIPLEKKLFTQTLEMFLEQDPQA